MLFKPLSVSHVSSAHTRECTGTMYLFTVLVNEKVVCTYILSVIS